MAGKERPPPGEKTAAWEMGGERAGVQEQSGQSGKDHFWNRHQVLTANFFSKQFAGKGNELALVSPVLGK